MPIMSENACASIAGAMQRKALPYWSLFYRNGVMEGNGDRADLSACRGQKAAEMLKGQAVMKKIEAITKTGLLIKRAA